MIEIIEVSPTNERAVADTLAGFIRRAWPDVDSSGSDRVRIIVGHRTMREIDLLVVVDLGKPRHLPTVRRRDGTQSPDASVQAAVIVIEVKQLEQSRFTIVGTEIFPDYRGKTGRSVNAQVDQCVVALRTHRDRYGVEPFFIHGVGWLTEVESSALEGVNPWIVGHGSGWLDILDAAARQDTILYGPKSATYRAAIATIADTLTRSRVVSPRDRKKSNDLCNDVIVKDLIDDLAERAGRVQIRLTGRGGSGKTTTLALLAKRLAEIRDERVLFLTFHRTLRGDIAHLVDTLVPEPTARARICVETATTFFLNALCELEIGLGTVDGQPNYGAVPKVLAETAVTLAADVSAHRISYLREIDPSRFAWDYVFIDESQDWHGGERDFIRALYGTENLVLADGLEQLVQRQTACDWSVGLKKTERYDRHLGRSLRMTRNVAEFANAFAGECGLVDWRIEPFERLPGGRVIVALGAEPHATALLRSLGATLAAASAAPVDALLCIPPPLVETSPEGMRRARFAPELADAGIPTWDASDDRVRDAPPTETSSWRIVQYDSSRGLEGWVTVCFALDQLVATKLKHPNLQEGDRGTAEDVANRWLMIALTRAVQTSIITIADPAAPLVATLRAATARLPAGVVEWTTTAQCPSLLGMAPT
jgi:hypothetical protein